MFYGRAIKLKGKKCINLLFVLFLNLLLIFHEKSIPIVLLYLHVTSMYSISYCMYRSNPKSPFPHMSNLNNLSTLTKYETYAIPEYVVPKLLAISGDIHPNPGPVQMNVDSSNNSTSYSNLLDDIEDFHANLSIIHLNIQSLLPKRDILNANLSHFDILCFTESWLTKEIPRNEIAFDGFETNFRNDRIGRPGGGVIVYIKDSIYGKRRSDLEINGLECVWIEFKIKNTTTLLGTFYRHPHSPSYTWNLIEESFELAIDSGIKNIIICGDFNENLLIDSN